MGSQIWRPLLEVTRLRHWREGRQEPEGMSQALQIFSGSNPDLDLRHCRRHSMKCRPSVCPDRE
jgi:hypothetical protein